MSLLIYSAPSATITAALNAIGSLAAKGSGTSANFDGTGSFNAGNSIELNVYVSLNATGFLQGISVGFNSASANLPATGDLHPTGGFGERAAFAGVTTLTGTVGLYLLNQATFSATGALTALGTVRNIVASLPAFGNLQPPTTLITGGTVSVSASLNSMGSLGFMGLSTLTGLLNFDGTSTLTAQGFPMIVGNATQMTLKFNTDQIRIFFRSV